MCIFLSKGKCIISNFQQFECQSASKLENSQPKLLCAWSDCWRNLFPCPPQQNFIQSTHSISLTRHRCGQPYSSSENERRIQLSCKPNHLHETSMFITTGAYSSKLNHCLPAHVLLSGLTHAVLQLNLLTSFYPITTDERNYPDRDPTFSYLPTSYYLMLYSIYLLADSIHKQRTKVSRSPFASKRKHSGSL